MSTGSSGMISSLASTASGIMGGTQQTLIGSLETSLGYKKKKDLEDDLKKLKAKYPEMDIPTAIVQATDLYRQASQQNMPGYDLYQQQLQQSTAQGVSASREAATSAADLLGATTSLYGQQSRAMTNLEIENARQRAQARQMYGQQLNTLGSWQQQQYYMNEYYPWVANYNELQGQMQGAYDMMLGGINTMVAGAGTMSSSGASSYSTPTSGYSNAQSNFDWNAYNQTMGASINTQGSTPLTTNQTMGQYQYNPSGQQTLGQYTYNPNNEMTLGQYMYGG